MPASSETIVTSSRANRARITLSAAASIAVVSSPPMPAPTTGSRSARPGSSSSTPRTSSTAALQSASQSVKRVKEQARRQLGKEVGALLRHRVTPPRDVPHVLDPCGPEQERGLCVAAVDGCNRVLALRRVRHTLRRDSLHDVDVEPVAGEQLVPAVAIENDPGKLVARLVDRRSSHAVDMLRDAVGRKDREPFLPRRHEHNVQVWRAAFLGIGERRLVAVMAVCDQQLGLLEARGIVDPPQLVAAALQIGLTRGSWERIALVEEEDRLELSLGRAKETQSSFLRAAMRAFVRQHLAILVRLFPERGHEAGT